MECFLCIPISTLPSHTHLPQDFLAKARIKKLDRRPMTILDDVSGVLKPVSGQHSCGALGLHHLHHALPPRHHDHLRPICAHLTPLPPQPLPLLRPSPLRAV